MPTVHSNPKQKRSSFKTLLKPDEFEKACFSFSCARKTFWKLVENDGVTLIRWFPWQSFSQTQVQDGQWLFRFQILPVDGSFLNLVILCININHLNSSVLSKFEHCYVVQLFSCSFKTCWKISFKSIGTIVKIRHTSNTRTGSRQRNKTGRKKKKNENTCGNLPRYLSNQACRFTIFFFNSPYNLFKLHFPRITSLINSGSRQRPLCEVEVWTQRVPLTPRLTLWITEKKHFLGKISIQRNNNFARH